jgi:hypothetical protein
MTCCTPDVCVYHTMPYHAPLNSILLMLDLVLCSCTCSIDASTVDCWGVSYSKPSAASHCALLFTQRRALWHCVRSTPCVLQGSLLPQYNSMS